MTTDEMCDLWDLARVIHEARVRSAWGPAAGRVQPWPRWSASYSHSPIAYVDLALASARAVVEHFRIDVALATGSHT